MLDTNIASHCLRRSSAALEERVNQGLLRQTLAIAVLTCAELRFGQAVMAADDRRLSLIDHFLPQLANLPWTPKAADLYGLLKDTHRRAGTPIGELDAQIAAHALAEGLTLVTHNTRHFHQVPALQVEDWMGSPLRRRRGRQLPAASPRTGASSCERPADRAGQRSLPIELACTALTVKPPMPNDAIDSLRARLADLLRSAGLQRR